MRIITNSEKETFKLAKDFSEKLKGGEIIGLIGDLGAGKTIFTKGLAKGLGVKKMVNSPTFVLMKIYDCQNHKTIKKLVHIDAYRLNSEKDIEAIGAAEYFGRADIITVIEWADKIKKVLPKNTKFITLKQNKLNRIIKIN
ncbi:tRNA (adenosine(37)-N6)-threonylcarbamoyltransferase complex ATPase subunit type 1 TsaE [Candidatus Falkowbacteria bacterium]|nr:MAG: tRNA (adenosine(37)-N6)-threonylcarbamoyltransferase complex ATPase subunit type 1 TsaE [Candidatus Falkowbacteria bacterium]